jgi:hypothetical protein
VRTTVLYRRRCHVEEFFSIQAIIREPVLDSDFRVQCNC